MSTNRRIESFFFGGMECGVAEIVLPCVLAVFLAVVLGP
jgi:hypothetical protein